MRPEWIVQGPLGSGQSAECTVGPLSRKEGRPLPGDQKLDTAAAALSRRACSLDSFGGVLGRAPAAPGRASRGPALLGMGAQALEQQPVVLLPAALGPHCSFFPLDPQYTESLGWCVCACLSLSSVCVCVCVWAGEGLSWCVCVSTGVWVCV